MMRTAMMVAALATASCFGAKAEDKIYRCGQTYQQAPCEQGQLIDASDERTAAQRRDARGAAKSEQQQAKDLVAERRQREKAITPQREPLRTGAPAPVAKPASAPAHGHPKKKQKKNHPDIEDPQYLVPKQPDVTK